LAGVIASGCHDPFALPALVSIHPSVSCQSIVVQAAVFAVPLCSQASLHRSISLCAHDLVTHASLPPSPPTGPPRLHTLYHTVHCSLATHPWVLRLANTSTSGLPRAFRQIIGPNLSLEEQALRDHMSADLSTTTTLHFHRTAHASFQP
jgi:hypothetical protein